MAKFVEGEGTPFSGNLGAVTGSSWRGIRYVKKRSRRRTKKASIKEEQNRSKFKKAHFWLQPLLNFVKEGFKDYSQKSFGFNAAKSHLLKNAIEGVAPDFTINPALVKVSAGDLPLSDNLIAEKDGNEKIMFKWNPDTPNTDPFDQVMLLAYDVTDKHYVFSRTTGQLRYIGTDTLLVIAGHKYHLYLAFNAADRSRRSDSVYLGEISM
jgi:hypothetical protein